MMIGCGNWKITAVQIGRTAQGQSSIQTPRDNGEPDGRTSLQLTLRRSPCLKISFASAISCEDRAASGRFYDGA